MGQGAYYLVVSIAGVCILSVTLGTWPTLGVALLVLGWTAWKGSNRE